MVDKTITTEIKWVQIIQIVITAKLMVIKDRVAWLSELEANIDTLGTIMDIISLMDKEEEILGIFEELIREIFEGTIMIAKIMETTIWYLTWA